MPHTFPGPANPGRNDGAGPPGPAPLSKNQVIATPEKPAGGPAADQGVRPTPCPGIRKWQKYVALGGSACPTSEGGV